MLMKRLPLARNFLAYSLLTLTALLAASCSSSSDSPTAEDTTTNFIETITLQPDNAPIDITAGFSYSCALHEGGTISCWGGNWNGQLGNGSEEDFLVPAKVADITDVTAINAGSGHTCALHQDGTISCWGNNQYGQLGNGKSGYADESSEPWEIKSSVPVKLEGIEDATAITAGSGHTCALHQDGTISCWGNNQYGQLGNGQSEQNYESSIPVQVASITNATAITAGNSHSCALHQDGTISCWGNNQYGRLGNGQSEQNYESSIPVQVASITNATAITAGDGHTCALHEDGTVSCWGNNLYGQLGNGQSEQNYESSIPVQVAGITNATAITAGNSHSCALHQDGTISCWGNNQYGRLGNGTDDDAYTPQQVAKITDATAISAGKRHSCALHRIGNMSCWGNNEFGQLGNGQRTNDSYVPLKVRGITDATAITAGLEHSCALHESGSTFCWGNNQYGRLGNGTNLTSMVPMEVAGITDAVAITAGSRHSCALHQDGTISCWGNNEFGQLGNGQRTNDSYVPLKVRGITDATAITAGLEHSCALHESGSTFCWGNNQYGRLGNGTNLTSMVPMEVAGITDAVAITAGSRHSCALHQDGTISCWGNNTRGQLGNGSKDDSSVPKQVLDITDTTAITTGDSHSCALRQDGTISCWGNNVDGQLGEGNRIFSSVPVQVMDITNATAITTGGHHSCALHEDGTISCWGFIGYKQTVTGDVRYEAPVLVDVPVQVSNITDATAITTGGTRSSGHSCALHEDGTVSCWGNNQYGQLGNGIWLPQPVVGFGG